MLRYKKIAHDTIDLAVEPEFCELLRSLELSLLNPLSHLTDHETVGQQALCERALLYGNHGNDAGRPKQSFSFSNVSLPRIRMGKWLMSFEEMQVLEDCGKLDEVLHCTRCESS